MTEEALEAKILEAFKVKHWPEQPSAVRITSTKWFIVRNELSGIIIRRTLSAVVASTRKPGKCQYQDFSFAQDYDGAEYQDQVYMLGVGGPHDMPCGCVQE